MKPILSMQVWLGLKRETRQKLRELLDIPRTGHVEVFDGQVLCDGTMMEDLMHITVEKMQKVLNVHSVDDFYRLFNACTLMVESPMVMVGTIAGKPVEEVSAEELADNQPKLGQEAAVKRKPGRPKKNVLS